MMMPSELLRWEEMVTLPTNERAWEEGRRSVDKAVHCSALPTVVLMATTNGFYQLVDAATGVFRRFGVFVAEHFTDVGPRCLAMDVSKLVVPRHNSLDDVTHDCRGLGVFFSLAYSSTLCRASIDTGDVIEMISFEARPSAIFADGDHVTAADGTGDVCLWRSSTPTMELLWRRKRISSGTGDITALCITRDIVSTGCADFTVKILSLVDGSLLASLLSEGSATIAGLTSLVPYADDIAVITNRGLLTVWRPQKVQTSDNGTKKLSLIATEGTTAPVPPRSALHALEKDSLWSVRHVVTTFPASCLHSSAGWIAVGGSKGQLALFAATTAARHATPHQADEAGRGSLPMAVCYDLNHSVVDAFIASDDHLCAVTSNGDLWRWALTDVLRGEEFEDQAADEAPRLQAPIPDASTSNVAPAAAVASALVDSHRTLPSANSSATHHTAQSQVQPPQRHASGSDGESADGDSLNEDDSASNAAAQVGGTIAAGGEEVIVVDMDVPTPPDGCLTEVTASSTRPGTAQQHAPQQQWPPLEPPTSASRQHPHAASLPRPGWTASEMPSSVMNTGVDDRTSRSSLPHHGGAADVRSLVAEREARLTAMTDDASVDAPEADHRGPPPPTPSPAKPQGRSSAALALYHPPPAIPGLRHGRRMDPRAAELAFEQAVESRRLDPSSLDELARPHDDNGTAAVRTSLVGILTKHQPPGVVDLTTEDKVAAVLRGIGTRRLEVPKQALQQYIEAHKTTVSALEFEHPIKPFMKFDPDDVVYSAVGLTSPLRRQASPKTAHVDDLAPVTVEANFRRRRDPVYERQKQVPAPRIEDHFCDELLYPPSQPCLFFDVVNADLPSHVPSEDPFPLPRLPGVVASHRS